MKMTPSQLVTQVRNQMARIFLPSMGFILLLARLLSKDYAVIVFAYSLGAMIGIGVTIYTINDSLKKNEYD